jgi:hypothetical protein
MYCALIEPSAGRGGLTMKLHSTLCQMMEAAGYQVNRDVANRTFFSGRLGGWLLGYYGPLHLLYEVNSQSPIHLTLSDLRGMGAAMAKGTHAYLCGSNGRNILSAVDQVRQQRAVRIASVSGIRYDQSAIKFEYEALFKSKGAKQDVLDPEILK